MTMPSRTLIDITTPFGLTDADFIANRETIEANMRRIVAERAAAAGMADAEYVTDVVLPRFVESGATDDQIVWFLGVFAQDSERDDVG